MDKASDFESEDCEFESRRGRFFFSNPTELNFYETVLFQFYSRKYTLNLIDHIFFHFIYQINDRFDVSALAVIV